MALSKEQKAAKKEAQRQEKIRKEIELRKKLKLDEVKREVRIQAKRKADLDKHYKEMMVAIKAPQFKQDIEVYWKSFERLHDKKDFLLQHYISIMNQAEDQYQRLFTSFSDKLDTQIKAFLGEIEEMSKKNEMRMAAIMQQSKADDDHLKKRELEAETQLKLFIYYAASTNEANSWQARGEYMVREDEDSTMFLNKREDLRSDLEDKYNSVWEAYKATLRTYIVSTADLQKKVKRLRLKDRMMSDIIAKQAKRINGNDVLVRHLKSELRAYETGSKQAVFRDRQARYRDAYLKLKVSMRQTCAVDSKNLFCLVAATTETIKHLENEYAKTAKILRFIVECRKYESLKEKVLPFGCKAAEIPGEKVRKSSDELLETTLAIGDGLGKLWQKSSRAELIKRSLLREKELLLKENALLERRLQESLENSNSSNLNTCICVQKTSNNIEKKEQIQKKDILYLRRANGTKVLM